MATETTAAPADDSVVHEKPIAIEDVAAWVLRIGVVVSVVILGIGLTLSFVHGGITKQVMETQTFDLNAGRIRHGLAAFEGFAWLELGILVLVATPILRVFAAMVLFTFEEHDRLYAAVTFLVLVMTLGSLLFVH